jgi:hypothetical protein
MTTTPDQQEIVDALEFYANPGIYKPHPHGLAFDRRDLSFCARSALPILRQFIAESAAKDARIAELEVAQGSTSRRLQNLASVLQDALDQLDAARAEADRLREALKIWCGENKP